VASLRGQCRRQERMRKQVQSVHEKHKAAIGADAVDRVQKELAELRAKRGV